MRSSSYCRARYRKQTLAAFALESEEDRRMNVKKVGGDVKLVLSCLLGVVASTALVGGVVVFIVDKAYSSQGHRLFFNLDSKVPDIGGKPRFIVPGAPYELPTPPPDDQLRVHKSVSRALTQRIQSELDRMQHQSECKKRGFLYCETPKEVRCFFTCHLRHIASCLVAGMASGRSVVVHERTGVFQTVPIWGKQMIDISTNCTPSGLPVHWPQDGEMDNRVLFYHAPSMEPGMQTPRFMPPTVPQELYRTVANITEAPAAWWAAQFMLYANQRSPRMEKALQREKKRFNLTGPVVGIAFSLYTVMDGFQYISISNVDEYMKHVSYYYQQLENQGIFVENRKVFVATENGPFILDLQEEYGEDYEIIALMDQEDFEKNLTREIVELQILSEVDYLVCQFSNLVCQTAYELRLLQHPERARSVASMLDVYRFAYGVPNMAYATEDHKPESASDIALEKGDRISIFSTLKNDELHGKNLRTGHSGSLPLEKISGEVPSVKFAKA